jgi:putative N6-adenine-specific DNA methylase
MSPPTRYDAFVITAPGLEPFAAAELHALGLGDARPSEGGVTIGASRAELYAANLNLRTASRIVVRAGEFGAKAFHELERRAAKVPWEAFVSPNLGVSLRVTCRKSRLYHSDAVAERVATAIASRVRSVRFVDNPSDASGTRDESDDGDGGVAGGAGGGDTHAVPHQLVLVRLFYDRCTVSVDSSGPLLHLRGYRQAVGKAPIRETLAAAALLAAGWRGDSPLLDPMCGSGTIPIEGALIARRMAPGLRRSFAFQHWPDFDAKAWAQVREQAEAAVLGAPPAVIQGSDRDAGAIESARANAERAGLGNTVEFAERSISAMEPTGERGMVVSNPPYGVRVGDRDRLRNLYAQFGKVIRAKAPDWRVALISADETLERQTGLELRPVLRTSNGGIRVRVVVTG